MSSEYSVDDATLNIVHLTDCHLTKSEGGELLGMNTRDSLEAVMGEVNKLHGEPDYVLATGDLAQDASSEAYQYFKSKMSRFTCPVSWFPGNHDDRDVMQQVVGAGSELTKVFRIGRWQFILLDSMVNGKVHGFLESNELKVLETALNERPDLHTIVCLHHHPVDIESAWLDNIGLHNRDDFFKIIDQFDNVKAILWGHIHQQLDAQRSGVNLFATPSTCIQFLPKSNDFAVDTISPGYRWMKLFPDGSIDTGVVRTTDFEFELDLKSNGY
ncbi:MAG: Icc protein [Oleiphilaceae bacterium]|jgi:Icc protein